MVELGVRWKEIKVDKYRSEDLEKFKKMAVEDKKRYDEEMGAATLPSLAAGDDQRS